ncbi:UDP-3-O-[3-hydroxymyristoyl] N-acetylglucosamine deacetylase, partial [bacterium]
HKILDFIGDIGLLSTRPEGNYFIIKGGHKLHLKLAETLAKEVNGAV